MNNFQKTQKSSNLASMKSYRPHPGADTLNFRDASIGLGPGGVAPQKSQKFEIQKISETAYKPPCKGLHNSHFFQRLLYDTSVYEPCETSPIRGPEGPHKFHVGSGGNIELPCTERRSRTDGIAHCLSKQLGGLQAVSEIF